MLLDQHGRRMTYLRLAVTDRCNLRCRYCMPAEGIDFAPRSALLDYGEIIYLSEVLAGLGIEKVRITGGEPLVRRDLDLLVAGLSRHFSQVAITTNGVLLPDQLTDLTEAGLGTFNVSLDTLRADRFRDITRRDAFHATWRAVEALLERGLPTKLNVVVMRGVNDDELYDFVELTRHRPLEVRFIEAMPFNADDGNFGVFIGFDELLRRMRDRYPELQKRKTQSGSAVAFSIPGFAGRVAIIPAYSRSLCGSCDRLRLTPRGTLLNCLYATQGLELLPLLRSGIDRNELAGLIQSFVFGKHATGHDTERLEQPATVFGSMTTIGG